MAQFGPIAVTVDADARVRELTSLLKRELRLAVAVRQVVGAGTILPSLPSWLELCCTLPKLREVHSVPNSPPSGQERTWGMFPLPSTVLRGGMSSIRVFDCKQYRPLGHTALVLSIVRHLPNLQQLEFQIDGSHSCSALGDTVSQESTACNCMAQLLTERNNSRQQALNSLKLTMARPEYHGNLYLRRIANVFRLFFKLGPFPDLTRLNLECFYEDVFAMEFSHLFTICPRLKHLTLDAVSHMSLDCLALVPVPLQSLHIRVFFARPERLYPLVERLCKDIEKRRLFSRHLRRVNISVDAATIRGVTAVEDVELQAICVRLRIALVVRKMPVPAIL